MKVYHLYSYGNSLRTVLISDEALRDAGNGPDDFLPPDRDGWVNEGTVNIAGPAEHALNDAYDGE